MSQHATNLLQYVDYNVWANKAIADFIDAQDNSILDKEIVSSFNTIRKTIFHLADAQHIWLSRLKGSSPTDWPSKTMKPEDAIPVLRATSEAYSQFCSGRDDSFWNSVCTFKALDGIEYKETIGNITMHVMNHGTFHRGQIITMLRQAGLEGKMPRTDLIAYLREING
jgi:uncharacterized damage-inducible protein DinB